jgi:hypothetical protein
MPKKAKVKAKKPARGIAVKQKQSVKQTVKVIVGDIAKKPVRRRTAKPKVATLIQGTGGGLSGSVAPEPLREPQPYSFVPDNRQPRYDFERIQPQPIENAKINLLDYKANNPSVSASGLISVAEQKQMMDERAKPMISDVSKEYEQAQKAEAELKAIKDKRRQAVEKRRDTMAKKKEVQFTTPTSTGFANITFLSGSDGSTEPGSEAFMLKRTQPRFLGEKELSKGFIKNRDEELVAKVKAFRKEQMKKRAIQALKPKN